ncbi:MAG: cytochrome C, partial [Acidobacteriota bacterium]
MNRTLAVLLILVVPARAALPDVDSMRGAQVFQTHHCIECHAPGKMGPDLGRIMDRGYTPDLLAGTMWNHAPTMWAAMTERSLQVAGMDRQEAGDLFAFFYSTRLFEEPGDAGRGA